MAKLKRPAWWKMFSHQRATIESVSDADAGQGLKAAFRYFDGEDVQAEEVSSAAFTVFCVMRPYLDESMRDYASCVQRGRMAADRRWHGSSPPAAPLSTSIDPASTPMDTPSTSMDPLTAPMDPLSAPMDPPTTPINPASTPIDPPTTSLDPVNTPIDPPTTPMGVLTEAEAEAEVIRSADFSANASPGRKRKVYGHDSQPYRAAAWLAERVRRRCPKLRAKTEQELQQWAVEFDRLNRIDGYAWDLISDVLAFSQEDDFWQKNILSGGKLRKQFETLLVQMGGRHEDAG